MKKCKTKIEITKNVFCPECFAGQKDAECFLYCDVCRKEIEEDGVEIVCGGNGHTHYHKKCYEKQKQIMENSCLVFDGVDYW